MIDKAIKDKKILYWRIGASIGFSAGVVYTFYKKQDFWSGFTISILSGIMAGTIAYHSKNSI
jgi:hypothetical protein